MKLTDLTWDQARNLLQTQLCEEIKYVKSFSNVFIYVNGFIILKGSSGATKHRLPAYLEYKFRVEK